MDDFQQYKIDFENGTIPIGELPIGDRVVDPSWVWEYRRGLNYSDKYRHDEPAPLGEIKPVTWIVVARDHYDCREEHVTLLTVDLIGSFKFHESIGPRILDRSDYNHWGRCGMDYNCIGLRPWLNSDGNHSGEGFYWAFSANFKQAVLTTSVPNKVWEKGSQYNTKDKLFIPSTTELGDTVHQDTYKIGKAFSLFQGASDAKRECTIGGATGSFDNYWTRSPITDSDQGLYIKTVLYNGSFYSDANYASRGIRPALNLKSGILVSEIRD